MTSGTSGSGESESPPPGPSPALDPRWRRVGNGNDALRMPADAPSDGSGAAGQAPADAAAHASDRTRRGPSLPEVPRTVSDAGIWLAIGALGYVVGQVMSAVLLLVAAAVTGHLSNIGTLAAESVPPAWVVVSGLIGLWIGFLGAVFVASRTRGTSNVRRDMGLSFRPWDAVVGPAVGLAGQLLLLPLLYLPLERAVPNLNRRLSQTTKHLTGGFPGADLVIIAVLTVLVVPVIEELLFRGLVLRACLRLFGGAGRVVGPALAMVTSGVIFGLAHAELLQLLGLAAFGVVLAALAYRTGRLGPSIFAHATFNLVAIVSVATTGAIH